MIDAPTLSVAEADEILSSVVLTAEGLQNPYPRYAALRAGAPRWRTEAGSIVLTGYDDCMEALRHPRLGRPEPDMDVPSSFGRPPGAARATPRRCCC